LFGAPPTPEPAVSGYLLFWNTTNQRIGAVLNPYIAQLTITFLTILTWAIIVRSLLSWFPIDQGSTLYQMLYRVTEPIIEPMRRVMPQTGMIDLSPLMAILVLISMTYMVRLVTVPA
jgi:YggT family protein